MTTHTTSETVAALTDAVEQLRTASQAVIDAKQAGEVDKDTIAETLYAASRLFTAKSESAGERLEWPIGEDDLTATETVQLVTALLDAADINIFDMAIWYRRV